MERRPCSILSLLFGILRAFGVFPYRWKYLADGQLEVTRSRLALIWSWIFVLAMVSLSLWCVINSPTSHNGKTSMITTHILNYLTYLTSSVFFLYLAFRGAKLAHILNMMSEIQIPLRRPILDQADCMQILCMVGITTGLSYATYSSLSLNFTQPISWVFTLYSLPATVCDCVIEITTLTLALLLYFILKILSLEGEAAVGNLDPTSSIRKQAPLGKLGVVGRKGDRRLSSTLEREGQPVAGPATERVSVKPFQPTDTCCVSRLLLALDDILVEVVGYTGPAAAMILLTSTVNATVMLYLTITKLSDYYVAYITLKTLSAIQVALIPDRLWCQRERSLRLVRRLLAAEVNSIRMEAGLREVEKILSTSTKFLVCRLFTLDRHIILSVASSVVTYLVIAFQFSFSESNYPVSDNCTVMQDQD